MKMDNYKDNYEISSKPYKDQQRKKTSLPTIAGIILIISGIIIIAQSVNLIIASEEIVSLLDLSIYEEMNITVTEEQLISYLNICGTVGIVISVFPILGGIMAIKRKMWGIALAGGIIGLFGFIMIYGGIFSLIGLIFVIMSRKEFEKKQLDFKIDDNNMDKI